MTAQQHKRDSASGDRDQRAQWIQIVRVTAHRVLDARSTLSATWGDLLSIAVKGRTKPLIGEGDMPELQVIIRDFKALEDPLARYATFLLKRAQELYNEYEVEFGEAPGFQYLGGGYAQPRDEAELISDCLSAPAEPGNEWYAKARRLAESCQNALQRLRRFDAVSCAAREVESPFVGSPLQWEYHALRWHLNGKPLHAGDPVSLLTDGFGWVGGRFETSDGGRRAHFCFRLGTREVGQEFSIQLDPHHRLAWPSEVEGCISLP